VLPVSSTENDAALAFVAELSRAGLRADADLDRESLSKRLVRSHEEAVPFLCVIGPKEAAVGSVSFRRRGESSSELLACAAAAEKIAAACARPDFRARSRP
jgi:threonyl-tRNA synthetase